MGKDDDRSDDGASADRFTLLEAQVVEMQRRLAEIEGTLASLGIRTGEEGDDEPAGGFRGQIDQVLLEMMKLHPDYEDIDEVLTREAIDEAFARMTEQYIEQEEAEADPQEVEEALRQRVWSMPNPYRFLYEMVLAQEAEDEVGGETEH